MIVIKFRDRYIYLDNFQVGFAAYVTTIGVMCVLEWRKKRKKKKRDLLSKCLNTTLIFRGGDIFVRRFLKHKLNKGTQYEVVDPRLIRYIRELTKTLNSKEILYIDLEILAHYLRTLNRPRTSEILANRKIQIFNSVRTIGSAISRTVAGVAVKLTNRVNLDGFISSVVVSALMYTLPYRYYQDSMLSELPFDHQNIQYLLKQPKVERLLVSLDDSPPECKVYMIKGKTILEKKRDESSKDSESIVVKHPPAKKKERKFNTKIMRLEHLSSRIKVSDYNEAKDDAEYVRTSKEREAIRIRVPILNNTINRDSE